LGEEKSVSWFEVKRDPVHLRIIKWVLAVAVALFLNWAYINGLPLNTRFEFIEAQEDRGDELTIEMVDELEEMQYVETNPDAVENEPDDTANFSNRNQQAAQEDVAGPEKNDTPFIEGQDEESPKIIEGQIPVEGEDAPPVKEFNNESSSEPRPAQEARQARQAMRSQQAQEQQEQQEEQQASPEMMPSIEAPSDLEELPAIPPPPPTPEFIDEVEPETEDGLMVPIIEAPKEPVEQFSTQEGEDKTLNINIPPSVAQQLSKAQEEMRKQQMQQPQPEQQPQEAQQAVKPQPMPRPRLSPKVLPGPLLESQMYAARMGPVAFDAKFSQFGYYLQRMFETIQLQWYSLLDDVTIGQEHRPAFALIEYDLNSEGRVVDTRVIETNAGDLATLLCRDAIESRAPFGPWTRQMMDQLGDQQTIRLKFIYL